MGNALDSELSTSLLRFWSDSSPTWQGPYIRVEWDRPDGITSSTFGRFDSSDDSINWQYGEPPAAVEEIALEAARYGTEYPIPNASRMGSESWEQMDAQCANRCGACGVVQGNSMTATGVMLMRHMARRGADVHDLAWAFGIHNTSVRDILSNKTWKDVLSHAF
jgi:hypothetical protein